MKWRNKVLEQVLTKFENIHGKESPELEPVLFDLADASINSDPFKNKPSTYRNSFNRIAAISKKADGENSVEHSAKLARIGALLLNKHQDKEAGRYLKKSHSIITSHHSDKDISLGSLLFNLGKYEMMLSKGKSATNHFENAITDFVEHKKENSEMALITRAFLVKAYESRGKSEKATKHCLAIGKATPRNADQEYMPIYKKAPEYPHKALNRGSQGQVTVEYDVDKLGFTRNHRIIDSTDEVLDKASVEAAKKFRYAPQFVKGEATTVKGVTNRFTYKISRR